MIVRLFAPPNLRENRRFSVDLGQDSPRTLRLRWTAADAGFDVFP
jgi:hypothetical protein